ADDGGVSASRTVRTHGATRCARVLTSGTWAARGSRRTPIDTAIGLLSSTQYTAVPESENECIVTMTLNESTPDDAMVVGGSGTTVDTDIAVGLEEEKVFAASRSRTRTPNCVRDRIGISARIHAQVSIALQHREIRCQTAIWNVIALPHVFTH